jgi:hypothetical protein
VFAAPTVRVWLMPSASQIWRYIGTIANPKPSMSTAKTRSFLISTVFSRWSSARSWPRDVLEDHDAVDGERHHREHHARDDRLLALVADGL